MKITSVKKIKPEQYEVLLSNGSTIILYEDVIVNNSLLNKEIDDGLYNKILKENESSKLEFDAIKYIEKKMRCESELRDYLYTKQTDNELINKIVSKLKDMKLIDDKSFAICYAKDKYNINKYGINKIINGLNEYGIDEDIIENAISFISSSDQLERINKIVERYINANKKDSIIKLKNKLSNHLYDKGYPKELINSVLNSISINNDNTVKKQYDKLYKKYSKKYEGDELNTMISNNLKRLGFSYEDINKLDI